MTIRVMIVDDSAVIRGMLTRAFGDAPEIEVVASLYNGLQAVEQIKALDVDVVILDVEMPQMGGIEALPKLLANSPQSRVIMCSTLTLHNAEISIKALEIGAADYIAKPSTRTDKDDITRFYFELIAKVRSLVSKDKLSPVVSTKILPKVEPRTASLGVATKPDVKPEVKLEIKPTQKFEAKYPASKVQAIAIGCSTGGPQALATLFKALKTIGIPNVPIFITQHMPPTFTTILAQHISQATGKICIEGKDGDLVEENNIYLAPGDYHMMPVKKENRVVIKINQNPPVNFCRPAVDPMLQSLVAIYGKNLLTVILTGMGSDGLGGSREVVKAGGTVIAQNEATCVVWGMPRAVTDNNLCSAVLTLEEIAAYMAKVCK